jgi:hypothetical protein
MITPLPVCSAKEEEQQRNELHAGLSHLLLQRGRQRQKEMGDCDCVLTANQNKTAKHTKLNELQSIRKD